MSPTHIDAIETVAIVREAFREEAEKWRRREAHRRGGATAIYNVWRAGYADGAAPDLNEPMEASFECHQAKTYAEANKIITDAAWAAAVVKLVEAEKSTA